MFSSTLTFDFDFILNFWGQNGLFLGSGQGSKTVLESTHVVTSILTFDFNLILGSFLTFWGPNGLCLGSGQVLKTALGSIHVVEQLLFSIVTSSQGWKTILGSTQVVEQLLFSMFSSIPNFDFDLILAVLAKLNTPTKNEKYN